MRSAPSSAPAASRSVRPRSFTVFAASFLAGAAAAVGVNSVLDVRLAQSKPQVESEPIFVALRSLPQGTPVTVWDVALRDWPRAMVPSTALRAADAFSGLVLKYPLREGQPLLSVQLVESEAGQQTPLSVTATSTPAPETAHVPDADLWATAEPARSAAIEAVPYRQPSGLERPQDPVASASGLAAASPPVAPPRDESLASTAATNSGAPAMQAAAIAEAQAAAETVFEELPTSAAVADDANAAAPQSPRTAPAQGTPVTAAEPTVPAIAPDTGTSEAMVQALGQPAADRFVANPAADVIAKFDPIATPPVTAQMAPTNQTAAVPVPQEPVPTLADPPLDAVGDQGTANGIADASSTSSVMRRVADTPPAQPAVAPARIAARYLVVPESIAQQADASFTTPRQPTVQPGDRAGHAVQPLPATAPVQNGRRQGTAVSPQRSSQQRSASSPATDSGVQRSSALPKPAVEARASGMFPGISAGVDSIEGDTGRPRRDRTSLPTTSGKRPQF